MNHSPFEPDHEDGERLLRSSLQRALLRPALASIARGVQQRLATLPVPSRFLRALMHYGSVVGLAVLVVAVASTINLHSLSRLFDVLATLPTAISATTIGIVAVLLCGFVGTELSRR